jgi:sRNA-binding carbon storage regulator CsrA
MLTLKRATGQTLLIGDHVRITIDKLDRDKLHRRQCHFLIEAPASIRAVPIDNIHRITRPFGSVEALSRNGVESTALERHRILRRPGQMILER